VINFRYHVVSLTAVFLALAIGLVVGTTALNGPVADTLKTRIDSLSKDNSNYREQANQYREELNQSEGFATELAPALLNGKLSGRRLLVVVLPSGLDYAEGVTAMLRTAGATVTAQVTLQDKFFDPANTYDLLDLAERPIAPSVPADNLPLNSDGVETSSALLSLTMLQKSPAVAAQDVTAVMAAYTQGGYLDVSDKAAGGAEATVIVSGQPPIDKDAAKKNQSAVTLTAQFAKRHPVVVAGTGIGDGNLVSEVRADPTLVKSISTVDNASTAQGQLSAALTTVDRFAGKVGHYGLAAGATSQVPPSAS
jgi:hypothetical protein